jgi:conjugal transfer/entry exclusion protein
MKSKWARAAVIAAGIAMIITGAGMIWVGVAGYTETSQREARALATQEQSKRLQLQIDQLRAQINQLKNVPPPK